MNINSGLLFGSQPCLIFQALFCVHIIIRGFSVESVYYVSEKKRKGKGGCKVGESELIGLIRSRDENGMTELLRRYGPLMRYIISPILTDERDRQECLSDAAMRAWDGIEKFDPDTGSFRTWLSAITRNTAINRRRTSKNSESDISDNFPAPESGPEDKMLRLERAEALKKAMQTLSNPDCALFYRKYYYMQSASQMAAELGMTERAVEGRLYRIKKKLRRAL